MHYCPISYFWILCALKVNRVVFKSFLEMQRRRRENQQQHRNVATLQRSNVITLQRRNVWSTAVKVKERLNVATFPRFLHHNYKKHGRPNFLDYRKTYERGAGNEARATREIEKTRVFVFLFSKTFMIYRTMLVLNSDKF